MIIAWKGAGDMAFSGMSRSKELPFGRGALPALELVSGTDRLDSWKAIANYLGREVRTVQLWEKREGLPVHRHFHTKQGSLFAFRSELDAWRRGVSGDSQLEAAVSVTAIRERPRLKTMIAVLPFEGLTTASGQKSFNNGVVSEIIAALGRVCPEHVGVISRTSVIQHKSTGRQSHSLGQSLNVTYLLEGSTQVDRGRIRVNIALVSATDRSIVCSQCFTAKFDDIFRVQSLVADEVAHRISQELRSSPESFPKLLCMVGSAPREAYILGRYFLRQRSEDALRASLRYFELAIKEDSRFALAHSGLADCLTLLSFYEMVLPAQVMPLARRAAQRAVELDPNAAEAHASLADVLFHFDRDWIRANQEYQMAIRCNPGYAVSYHWYANLLTAQGRHEAAYTSIMQALDIDPVSLITIVWAGVTSHFARHYEEAIRYYRKALDINPQFVWAHMYMAQTLAQMGNISESLVEFEKTIHLSGGSDSVKAMKAYTYAIAGDGSSALQIVDDVTTRPSQSCVPSYDVAAVYSALGDCTKTITWLYRACGERNMKLFALAQDPRFDAMRQNAEFKKLLDQAGLRVS
jgi:TolB-like protein/Tfp pilus assembly protein PilF